MDLFSVCKEIFISECSYVEKIVVKSETLCKQQTKYFCSSIKSRVTFQHPIRTLRDQPSYFKIRKSLLPSLFL